MLIKQLTAQQQTDITDCYDKAVANTENKSDEGQIYYAFIDYIDDHNWVTGLKSKLIAENNNDPNGDIWHQINQELYAMRDPVKVFAKGQAVNQ